MKILLCSYFFPPFNTIGAVRVGKIASHWVALGHDVRVLTADDLPLQRGLDQEISDELVIRTKWLDVNALPQMALGGRQVVANNGYHARSRILRLVGMAYKSFLNVPDGQVGWLPYSVKAGLRIVREFRPDFIYASGTPFSGLIAASIISKLTGVPWIAEMRDLWVDSHSYQYGRVRSIIDLFLEMNTLRSALGIVTVSSSWADIVGRKYGLPSVSIMNGYDIDDIDCDGELESPDYVNLLYTGMVYESGQDISPLLEALRLGRFSSDQVRLNMYGRYLGNIVEKARAYSVSDLVYVHSPIPRRESLCRQRKADALVYLSWNGGGVAARGVYPGKIFEYIQACRPIIAVGTGMDAASDLIRERELGIVSDDPEALCGYISNLVSSKRRGDVRAMGVNQDLERSHQLRKLDTFVLGLVGGQNG